MRGEENEIVLNTTKKFAASSVCWWRGKEG